MSDNTSSISTPSLSGAAEQTARIAPTLAAILLGAFLVLGVGFAHSDTIHNAAHDSRHSFAFPCH
jgi:cobalt transporter subunit CbtB